MAIVDAAGTVALNRSFAHDRAGLEELMSVLADMSPSPAPVAIERAEGILVETLQAGGHAVYPVSPRIAARARERYQAAPRKDDRFDAFVLADTLRSEMRRWRALAIATPTLAELRVLVRERRRLLESQQAVESQLRSQLEAYHPAVIHLFSSVDRAITLSFIREYSTPQAASRLGPRRMEAFLARHGYTGRVPPEVLVERLRAGLLAPSEGTGVGHRFATLALVDHLELLNRQLKAYDVRVASVFARHPDGPLFASFPGVGPVIGSSLLAEVGEDRARFPTLSVMLAEAGLAPVTRASGKVTRVRFRRACNTRLRDTFSWWAYTLKRIDEPTRLVYLAALERGQHPHRALRGIGGRWARVLWRCWQNRTCYDPSLRGS